MDDREIGEILRALPDLYLVVGPDLVIQEASEAYVAVTKLRRDELVGREVRDARVRASLQRAITTGWPDVPPIIEWDDRRWKSVSLPVLGEGGTVHHVVYRLEDITELHDAAVRSAHFRRLLDSAPDAIVIVGETGRIELVNAQTEAMFGYAREELIGSPVDVLIPERFHSGHAAHLQRYLARPGARPMGSGLRLFGRRKDGSELPIEVSLSPQRDDAGMTVSAAIRDVTERTRLEAAARLTADRLASAVESIEHAFALFGGDDRLILCNSVFRLFVHEAGPGALVGKHYTEILDGWLRDVEFADDAAREAFRAERIAGRSGPTSMFDVRLRDGRSMRVIDRHTPEGGIVKTILDRTEDELHAQELREARTAAEAASAAKSEFLSSMSHELRTPLNAILGFAQLLERDKREPLSARHRERLQQILRGGEHLLRLIDDILDLSRIEAGRISVSPEPVGVAEVLGEVHRTLEAIAARQHIALAIEPLPPHLPMIIADRTRFAQILMNFGSNAIKYNRPHGSVRFVVELASPLRLRIAVRDTGVGVSLASQDKLFQPFQRAGQELGSIEGTGIGLAITKRLAELMGGAVGFESTPDVGSTFWVEMPVHSASVDPRPAPVPLVSRPVRVPDGMQLVLYVEDNPANVVFMQDLIGGLDGLELVTVPTAELGVELARARRPAVVLMDINLPGMSGLEALAALRDDPETAGIPVIALTAAAAERDRKRGLEAGFFRYLTKPVDIDELIVAIEAVLDGRAALA